MSQYKGYYCRYSLVAPIALLEEAQEAGCLGNYLLLLAQDVSQNIPRYKALIENIPEAGRFVILDNGAAELDHCIVPSDGIFQDIISEVPIDAYVLPDVLRSYDATRELIERNLEAIQDCDIPFIRVPQGYDNAEILQCIEWMEEVFNDASYPYYPGRGYMWAVPRWISNVYHGRTAIVQYLNSRANTIEMPISIHLLGMSQNYYDDIRCTSLPNVMGIDSANPLTLGQRGITIESFVRENNPVPHEPRGTLWEQVYLGIRTKQNIEFVRQEIKRAHPGVDKSDVKEY